ncbi:putative cytoplasmic protein [Desulfovibrio sp. X2]|uniref:DUF4747 family protein n=1 Tax=Desulfovibrio sp. X2 TaxID=941449 RepID=UPI000358BC5A|nr:DUF4747 family protein [Desulfovibrio sp. X2]EPR42151.1 putative cytoplasmic protein [Desulfovibrio sp. X2]
MPHLKKLSVAAINVTTEPPHHPSRYLELFELIRGIQPALSGGVHGDRRMMLHYFAETEGIIKGAFATYTQIDPESPWWDAENHSAILDNHGRPVPQVKLNLGPNFRDVNFIFYSAGHKLFIDTSNISPLQFARAFSEIANSIDLFEKMGRIGVTVEPARDLIDRIVSFPYKQKITINFIMPNPDITNQSEERIVERFQKMNASRTNQTYNAIKGTVISPDEELNALMEMASSNGHVEVSGKDGENRLVTLSSKDYPLKEVAQYSDALDYWSKLQTLAESLWNRLINRKKH